MHILEHAVEKSHGQLFHVNLTFIEASLVLVLFFCTEVADILENKQVFKVFPFLFVWLVGWLVLFWGFQVLPTVFNACYITLI